MCVLCVLWLCCVCVAFLCSLFLLVNVWCVFVVFVIAFRVGGCACVCVGIVLCCRGVVFVLYVLSS